MLYVYPPTLKRASGMQHQRFDCRLEDQQWSRRFKAGEGADSILAEWQAMSREFEEIRKPYLLYS